MKYLSLICFAAVFISQSCNYSSNFAFQTHEQAGAWVIEKIEHFEWDAGNKIYNLTETFNDAGYFHLYDNDNTSTIVYLNNCHVVIKDSAELWVINDIHGNIQSGEWLYWYAENDRLSVYFENTQQLYGQILTIIKTIKLHAESIGIGLWPDTHYN